MIEIGFTGHRKDKLDMYVRPENETKIILRLYKVIVGVIQDNPKEKKFHFRSGGAIGFDQIAFKVVNIIKKKFSDLIIINEIDVPFKNQYIKWEEEEKKQYFEQLEIADKVVMVDELVDYHVKGLANDVYHPAKMDKRNRHMVDKSIIIIALWNGDKDHSGTYNCIKYARRCKKNIIYINPKEIIGG